MCVCVDMYNTSSSSSCVCVGFHQERATSYVNWNHHHGKCIISWLIAKFRGLSLRDSCIFKSIRNRRRRGGTDIRHNHQLLLPGWTCWQLFLLFVGRIFVFFNCCWTLERWTFVSFLSATTFHLNRTTSIVPWRVVVVVVGFPAQHFQKSLFLFDFQGEIGQLGPACDISLGNFHRKSWWIVKTLSRFIANRFSAEKSHVIYRHSIDPSESPLSSSTTTPKRINGKQSKQNGLLFFLFFCRYKSPDKNKKKRNLGRKNVIYVCVSV